MSIDINYTYNMVENMTQNFVKSLFKEVNISLYGNVINFKKQGKKERINNLVVDCL